MFKEIKEIKEIKEEDRNINSDFDPKALEIDEEMMEHIKELWNF